MSVIKATYTSVFDDSFCVTTSCKYDLNTKTVFDIETADVDVNENALTDEYVTVNGEELREDDGVTFDY